jgi:hypothetical protein
MRGNRAGRNQRLRARKALLNNHTARCVARSGFLAQQKNEGESEPAQTVAEPVKPIVAQPVYTVVSPVAVVQADLFVPRMIGIREIFSPTAAEVHPSPRRKTPRRAREPAGRRIFHGKAPTHFGPSCARFPARRVFLCAERISCKAVRFLARG